MAKAALTLEALRMATARRQPGLGVIRHSNQGVHLVSGGYMGELKRHRFLIDMAHTGNPYENDLTESLFTTLKYEKVCLCEYQTFENVVAGLPYSITEVYNQERLHSAPGYRSPTGFEEIPLNQENNERPRHTLLTLSVQS